MSKRWEHNWVKKESEFTSYVFDSLFKSKSERHLLEILMTAFNSYIFGGVIRDYFLTKIGTPNHKDIDIVVDKIDKPLQEYLTEFIIRKTRFGGYKIVMSNNDYDIWPLHETWAFKKTPRLDLDFDLFQDLPSTSFFNITAVVYSLENRRLIQNKKFKSGIEYKKLDIVYKPNPFPELCFIKAFEYKNKYNMTLTKKLERYLINIYPKYENKLISSQEKHYGEIKFTYQELHQFYRETIKHLGYDFKKRKTL